MCDPNPRNRYEDEVATNALPNAPHFGRWFPQQFEMLVRNAYPPVGSAGAGVERPVTCRQKTAAQVGRKTTGGAGEVGVELPGALQPAPAGDGEDGGEHHGAGEHDGGAGRHVEVVAQVHPDEAARRPDRWWTATASGRSGW